MVSGKKNSKPWELYYLKFQGFRGECSVNVVGKQHMNFPADTPFLWIHFGEPLILQRTLTRQSMYNGNVIC